MTDVKIPRRRFSRIIPFAFVMYMIAYMDRVNVSYGLGGIEKGLGLSPALVGVASGIFFLGYLVFQIPGGQIAKRYGVKRLLFTSQLIWGILALASGLVQNGAQFMVVRFLLGMAEGVMVPALLVMVTEWFPARERGRANSLWQLGLVVASVLVGPLSGWILTYSTWRWLFILQAVPAIVWAFVWLFAIPEKPDTARFLSDAEREYLKGEFAEDAKNAQPIASTWREVLTDSVIWRLIIAFFFSSVGTYGITLWLPTVLGNLTKAGIGAVGLLGSVFAIAGIIGTILIPRHSDKTGERKLHVSFSWIIAAAMLLGSALTGQYVILPLIFLLIGSAVGSGAPPTFWTFPPMFVNSLGIGFAMGFINGVGSLGGFFGPTIVGYIVQLSGSTSLGLGAAAASWALAGIIILTIKIKRTQPKGVEQHEVNTAH